MEVQALKSGELVTVMIDEVDLQTIPGRISVAGNGYAQMWINSEMWLVHRWILGLSKGDGKIVDHISGNKLDNRRSNLRVVTPAKNGANKRAHGRSGFRGVYQISKNSWEAKATLNYQVHHLGYFGSPQEAYEAGAAWRQVNMPGYVERVH